jgi:hypothetical protein
MKITIVTLTLATLVLASSAFASAQLRGKILGVFVRGPYDGTIDQSGLKRYIRTSNVWCAWSNDGHVIVHVTMHNGSAEHVTVNWYPRYAIRAGGIHGDGFSSAQSNGFDSGETRSLNAKQSPKGVRKFTRLAWCRPHFQMIESG